LKKLDPNNYQDLEIIKGILEDLNISFQIAVLFENQIVRYLKTDTSIDLQQAAVEANFWRLVYLCYSEPDN